MPVERERDRHREYTWLLITLEGDHPISGFFSQNKNEHKISELSKLFRIFHVQFCLHFM